jgi:predicted N-acetyltransferase YhbS
MIRASKPEDRAEIRALHLEVFGTEEGPEVAGLVEGLFDDQTASPLRSLVAVEDAAIVEHVLLSRARLWESPRGCRSANSRGSMCSQGSKAVGSGGIWTRPDRID